MSRFTPLAVVLAMAAAMALSAPPAAAHEPEFTQDFDRERCTFVPFSNNPWFPLWPGYSVVLEGEEEDEGEVVELEVVLSVLTDTELVDGVLTRVVEERESEDGELVEVSRNFMAECRETGAVWYFGEDVDDFEDGEIVGHEGAWRAGVDGALPGLFMPGTPLVGSRFQTENAPGVAEDRAEIVAKGVTVETPFATFDDALQVLDTNPLDDDGEGDPKLYVPGVGLVKDEEIELVEVNEAPCMPDPVTLCLEDGRFRVQVEWMDPTGNGGLAPATQITDDSGEFWFFQPDNVELLVKVLDACVEPFDRYWVFAAGLTNVEIEITVTDTATDITRTYENPQGNPFDPVQDTAAFECP
ncbi:MAG TPA: hypothetical protein VF100_08755 [Thermoanaerobaculia bacterium]